MGKVINWVGAIVFGQKKVFTKLHFLFFVALACWRKHSLFNMNNYVQVQKRCSFDARISIHLLKKQGNQKWNFEHRKLKIKLVFLTVTNACKRRKNTFDTRISAHFLWEKKRHKTGNFEQKQLKKETALTPEFLFT